MIKVADRVKETSLTQGVGTLALEGAFGGFQSFASGIGAGNSTYYAIENESKWEVGLGTYETGSNALTRDTIFDSSNSGEKINLDGVSVVFCTYPADQAVLKDTTGISNLRKTLTLTRTSPGNFIHAYNEDSYNRTIALYSDGGISPEWRLGLKTSPASESSPPSHGYAYGEDGKVGLIANSTNSFKIANNTEFAVKHNNVKLMGASSFTGINFTTDSPAFPSITINAAPGQSANIQEWKGGDSITVASLSSNGDIETSGSVTLVKTLKILDVPSYDPGVAGAVWKDGNHLMISDG